MMGLFKKAMQMHKEDRKEKFEDIYFNNLGMCGCGTPNEVQQFFYDLLENHRMYKDNEITMEVMRQKRNTLIRMVNPDVIFEIIFHIFENADLLEHGSSVYGSWFTEEGESFLKLLKEFKDEE